MNISEKFKTLIMSEQDTFSEELNQYIRMHNKAISEFAQSITTASIVSLLIKKGILTDAEISEELTRVLNENQSNIKQIENNRDMLYQLIEYETEYAQNLKDMHDNLSEQEGTEVTFTADGGVSTSELDNTTDIGFNAMNSSGE